MKNTLLELPNTKQLTSVNGGGIAVSYENHLKYYVD